MVLLYPALVACSLLLVSTTTGQSFCDDNDRTCFNEPQDCTTTDVCEMTMTSKTIAGTNTTKFILTGKSVGWIAVGISGDKTMDEDDVIMCAWDGSDVQLLDRYNEGRTNVAKTNPSIGTDLRLVAGTYTDGVISCEFDRNNTVVPNDPQHFGLQVGEEDFQFHFHLLFGRGPLSGSGVTLDPAMHEQIPWISDMPVNLGSGDRITRVTPSTPTVTPEDMDLMTTSLATYTAGNSIVLHLVVSTMMMVSLAIGLV